LLYSSGIGYIQLAAGERHHLVAPLGKDLGQLPSELAL
jgi:hypothetical protein